MDFPEFFRRAAGSPPYPWQLRLATAEAWPDLLRIPTGCGKTAVILAWLWRKLHGVRDIRATAGTRLVYVLPQRSLVTQTADTARRWLSALGLEQTVGLAVLMGGSIARDWDLDPNQPWIIIGTQDQLLSRALNRGYGGVSRFRWPLQFAWLHNDVQWIVDEIQLFGDGLATTAQLQAFRERFGTYGPAQTLWMSATASPDWLKTVDVCQAGREITVWELSDEDRRVLRHRLRAPKLLQRCNLILGDEAARKPVQYASQLCSLVLEGCSESGLTVVLVNRVDRAQAVYQALKSAAPSEDVRLIHSQFRSRDRTWLASEVQALRERRVILVSTQVIEAGIDLDATVLFTELAPWASLVQRFGRLNRAGRSDRALAFWIDVDPSGTASVLPYRREELERSRSQLAQLTNVGPDSLPGEIDPIAYERVLRKRDLVQLFDTTPDLSGNDIDVSPFIREVQNRMVSVYWGTWTGPLPPESLHLVDENDVCRVPVARLRDYLKKKRKIKGSEQTRVMYTWSSLKGRWERVEVEHLFPGRLYLLHAEDGGYSAELGFDPDSWSPVPDPVSPTALVQDDAEDSDADNGPPVGRPLTLEQHTLDVERETDRLLPLLPDPGLQRVLLEAAFWHDSGKRHPLFQTKLRVAESGLEVYKQAQGAGDKDKDRVLDPPKDGQMLAKSGGRFAPPASIRVRLRQDSDRAESAPQPSYQMRALRGFRHEFASALAYLAQLPPDEVNDLGSRLTAYLIAAHHGKIRGQIRASVRELVPEDGRLFARGVWQGDELPEYVFSDGRRWPGVALDLSFMQAGHDDSGRDSWAYGVRKLLDAYGPFRLAWLEALLRVADGRASRREEVLAHGE